VLSVKKLCDLNIDIQRRVLVFLEIILIYFLATQTINLEPEPENLKNE